MKLYFLFFAALYFSNIPTGSAHSEPYVPYRYKIGQIQVYFEMKKHESPIGAVYEIHPRLSYGPGPHYDVIAKSSESQRIFIVPVMAETGNLERVSAPKARVFFAEHASDTQNFFKTLSNLKPLPKKMGSLRNQGLLVVEEATLTSVLLNGLLAENETTKSVAAELDHLFFDGVSKFAAPKNHWIGLGEIRRNEYPVGFNLGISFQEEPLKQRSKFTNVLTKTWIPKHSLWQQLLSSEERHEYATLRKHIEKFSGADLENFNPLDLKCKSALRAPK